MGHLAPTETIGLLLQYLISEPIQKSTGRTVFYTFLKMFINDVHDMLCMFMKFAEPYEKVAPHRKTY